jgi:hypothetical protein
LLPLCAAAVFASACGSDTPTSPTTTTTSPVTETWSGIVGPAGSLTRSLNAAQAGTLTVTLTTSDAALGLGIGVPRSANAGCRLTVSQVDVAGQTVSVQADAGSYCVEVFDDGGVVKQAAFTVQIVHP